MFGVERRKPSVGIWAKNCKSILELKTHGLPSRLLPKVFSIICGVIDPDAALENIAAAVSSIVSGLGVSVLGVGCAEAMGGIVN